MPVDISIRDLTKRYGAMTAVDHVSFEIASGEIFGLLGPNGAGKTTTMECLLGLRIPDSGEIFVGGKPSGLMKDKIGAVLQSTALQDKIHPREALQFFSTFYPHHLLPDDLLQQFDLTEKADSPFDSLSGGQKQRLALAMAMINDPELLILDEPTANLDPEARRQLQSMIASNRGKKTILLSTHNIEEAHRLCDRIAIIHRGKIAAIGKPGDLIAVAKSPARIFIKTEIALKESEIRSIRSITSSEIVDSEWRLGSSDPTATAQDLLHLIESQNNQLLDLQVRRPSLEDVFLELTSEQPKAGV